MSQINNVMDGYGWMNLVVVYISVSFFSTFWNSLHGWVGVGVGGVSDNEFYKTRLVSFSVCKDKLLTSDYACRCEYTEIEWFSNSSISWLLGRIVCFVFLTLLPVSKGIFGLNLFLCNGGSKHPPLSSFFKLLV